MRMLIDAFLPEFHVSEYHEALIQSDKAVIFENIRTFDFRESPFIKLLFRMRGFSGDTGTLDHLLQEGFILLGEEKEQELAFGIAGKFWTASGCLQELTIEEFRNFNKPGYAKAVWNFAVRQAGAHQICLSTETRVYCFGQAARSKFFFYWFFISPLSSLIRKTMLHIIKQHAERSFHQSLL